MYSRRTGKNSYGIFQTERKKNEIDFVLTLHSDIVKVLTVLKKLRPSEHRMMKWLSLRKEREKSVHKKQPNNITIRERANEFNLKILKRFSNLSDEVEDNTEEANDKFAKITMGAGFKLWELYQGTVAAIKLTREQKIS